MSARVYLDWNATAPLRDEARQAMAAAMAHIGNPSSVHTEGRAAKAVVERARGQIAAAFGAEGADIVFVSGATEAVAMVCAGRDLHGAAIEHDAVGSWVDETLAVRANGMVDVPDPQTSTLQYANSETGVIQDLPERLAVCDATQAWGKVPLAFNWLGCTAALSSAHKLGGPKGIGALMLKRGTDISALLQGGGQEMGRRAGTENVIGIAGFGAAAEAAARDLSSGVWDGVLRLRDMLEAGIAANAPDTIFVGQAAPRLPNTSCFATPGWKGETQVMSMDLAGFAISAGSACSSGKVRVSKVLKAMGFESDVARSAIRVSIGPSTTEQDIGRFIDAWGAARAKMRARAA